MPGSRAGRCSSRIHRLVVGGVDVLGAVGEHGHEPGRGMVEGELGGQAVGLAGPLPGVAVQQGVDVVALVEHAPRLVQCLHLVDGPAVPRVVVAVEHPVHRQEAAPVGLAGDARGVGVAERLQLGGGDEALARELVGADHAARVEVVPLVPAVVRHLVAAPGLDQGDEHRPQLDRLGAGDDGVLARRAFGSLGRPSLLAPPLASVSVMCSLAPSLAWSRARRLAPPAHACRSSPSGSPAAPPQGRAGPGPCSRPAACPTRGAQVVETGGAAPGPAGTTKATPISPSTGSGAPTTATWATPGTSPSTASTSAGYTLYPPRMYISDTRPTRRRLPSVTDGTEIAGGDPALGVEHRRAWRRGRAAVARGEVADVAAQHRARAQPHPPHLADGARARRRRRRPRARRRARVDPPWSPPPRRRRRDACRCRARTRSRCSAPPRDIPGVPAWRGRARAGPATPRCRRCAGSTRRLPRDRRAPASGPTGSAPPGRR